MEAIQIYTKKIIQDSVKKQQMEHITLLTLKHCIAHKLPQPNEPNK